MAYETIPLSRFAQDITGQVFGRLVAIAPVGKTTKGGIKWLCICACTTETVVYVGHLRAGSVVSCGCFNIESARKLLTEQATTHGLSGHPLFTVWCGMKARCFNPNDTKYRDYGGRGITVCDRWLNSPQNFIDDMGEKPSPRHSIDRVDNNQGYSPENCCWASPRQQGNNKRNNIYITHNGERLTATQWSRRLGGCRSIVHGRLIMGWSEERAVTEPKHHR